MAETYGRLLVQAPQVVLQAFHRHREDGLEALVAFANADATIIDDCDVFFDELSIQGNCGYFYFEDPYWPKTVQRFIKSGHGVGWYLHYWDEYGANILLAHTPEGDSFFARAEGPDYDEEDEGGDALKDKDVQQWWAIIPDEIKQAFPVLAEQYAEHLT
ncbi:hypothetical protein [uncultured Microbulbifer sp.]|uniref:hypothetical protein n=1 Tax=uncultured Microbulbifer sp. TaxID=348147 RepID=UPI0026236CA4|nr:hypothetical protein [uncultured Microbulbifer sp.]